jgi:hypothetical protein
MVTIPKIVHCTREFKGRDLPEDSPIRSGSRHKPFENHLIRVAGRPLALL